MHHLNFFKNGCGEKGFIGGGIYYCDDVNFLIDNNYIPFLTLNKNFFPHGILEENEFITIFLNKKIFFGSQRKSALRNLTINDSSQILKDDYIVIKYKSGVNFYPDNKKEILPKIYFKFESFSNNEIKDDFEGEFSGLQITKAFGRLGNLQDEIDFGDEYYFLLQIFEDDLVKFDKIYNGIFNDGALYFFINKNLDKIIEKEDVGRVFAQFI